jgi:L-iditol 2-dehydrogenase
VAVDIVRSRLDFAKEFAATMTYEMQQEEIEHSPVSVRSSLRLPNGPDVVIEATGVASCINHGVTALRRGGMFVQAGLGASRIDFAITQVCDKEATVKGSFRYGPGDYKLAVELLRTGKVIVKPLITHRFGFDDAEQAFLTVSKRQGIKSIIRGPGVSSALAESTSKTPVDSLR